MIVSLDLLRSTALREVSDVSAQCVCAGWNPDKWQHGPLGHRLLSAVALGSEIRSSSLACCLAVGSPCWRDVGGQYRRPLSAR